MRLDGQSETQAQTELPVDALPESEEAAGTGEPTASATDAPAGGDPRAEIEALVDSHRRLAADFANYRRRVERDRAEWEAAARGDLLLRLLPAFDNLRRARAAVDGTADGGDLGALRSGLDMVLRGLDETLQAIGLEDSVRVGDLFDPKLGEALGEEATEAVMPGHVSDVLQPGYRLGERVLRPALVRVATAPSPARDDAGVPDEGAP